MRHLTDRQGRALLIILVPVIWVGLGLLIYMDQSPLVWAGSAMAIVGMTILLVTYGRDIERPYTVGLLAAGAMLSIMGLILIRAGT